jgi:hypothetical protein
MWNPNWPVETGRAPWGSECPECWWSHTVHARDVEARRSVHHERHFDLSAGSDGGAGAQWAMGNPGNWGVPGGASDTGMGGGGFGRHLGHLGPPVVEPPHVRRWREDSILTRRGAFTGRGPKGWRRSDSRILEDVCDALMQDGDVDAAEIEVTTKDGEVTLEGLVSDRRQKRRVEEICDSCLGVKDVHNKLRVAGAKEVEASPEMRTVVV